MLGPLTSSCKHLQSLSVPPNRQCPWQPTLHVPSRPSRPHFTLPSCDSDRSGHPEEWDHCVLWTGVLRLHRALQCTPTGAGVRLSGFLLWESSRVTLQAWRATMCLSVPPGGGAVNPAHAHLKPASILWGLRTDLGLLEYAVVLCLMFLETATLLSRALPNFITPPDRAHLQCLHSPVDTDFCP